MNRVSCTKTHYGVADLVNHAIVKNIKTLISRELSYEIKTFLTYTSDDTFREFTVL